MNKTKFNLLLIFILCFVIVFLTIFLIIFVNKKDNNTTFGVWWWNNRLDISYLDYAKSNNINEIYYYTSSFNEKTNSFIANAKERNIKVYWLTGEYDWINDSQPLINLIEEFNEYQHTYDNTFEGIHFDIEPHQDPNFENNRQMTITKYINLVIELKKNYPNIWMEYDIPFWLEDEITINGKTKPAYQFVMDNSNRVTVMSYRDTSQQIYNVAKEEIQYAQNIGKTLNLGVETQNVDDDIVTFYEEGKNYMYNELQNLRELIPKDFGIVIHHIYSWYNLKE